MSRKRRWSIALSGGTLDGKVVELDALGRMLIADIKLHLDGSYSHSRYRYTGLVPRLRTAFAVYDGEGAFEVVK